MKQASQVGGLRQLQLGSEMIAYRLQRSTRRTIGFVIDDSGLRVIAPRWVPLGDIELTVRSKQTWILAKLQQRRQRAAEAERRQMAWCDGARLPYLGGALTLRLRPATTPAVRHDESTGELAVHLPDGAGEQALKDIVREWLQRQAHALFAQRLRHYAMQLGVQYGAFRLTSARTQWGSCTAAGVIRLNWRLVHFGHAQIDYVIAHELAHLREMNHSPRFWAVVASVFPDFAAARKVLRERGPELMPTF